MTETLIRGGTLVTADGRRRADLLCRDGLIAAIGTDLEVQPGSQVDRRRRLLRHARRHRSAHPYAAADDGHRRGRRFPHRHGGCRCRGHHDHPGFRRTRAAASRRWRRWQPGATGRPRRVIDYGFHMTVSWWGPRFSDEMATLVRDHGITSFKFFLAYKGGLMLPDEDLDCRLPALPGAGCAAPGPRRERRAHRLSAGEDAGRRRHLAAGPCAVPSAAMRRRSDAAAPSPWRRSSMCRCTSCMYRRRRRRGPSPMPVPAA